MSSDNERTWELLGDIALRVLADCEQAMKKASGAKSPERIQKADGYCVSSTPAVRPDRDDSVGTDRAMFGEGPSTTLPADENAACVECGAHEPGQGLKAPSTPAPVLLRRPRRRYLIANNDNVAHVRHPPAHGGR